MSKAGGSNHANPLRSCCALPTASSDGNMLSYIARASRIKRARSSSDLGTKRMTSPMGALQGWQYIPPASWFKSSELEDPFPSQELISGRTAPCEKSTSFRGALKEKIGNCGIVSGALTLMLGRPSKRPGTCTVTSIPGSDPMEIKPNQIWRKERELAQVISVAGTRLKCISSGADRR